MIKRNTLNRYKGRNREGDHAWAEVERCIRKILKDRCMDKSRN